METDVFYGVHSIIQPICAAFILLYVDPRNAETKHYCGGKSQRLVNLLKVKADMVYN